MFRWAPYTFVRILAFLIVGIVVGIYNNEVVPLGWAWWILGLITIAYIILFILWHYIFFFRYNPGIVGLAGIFVVGYILAVRHDERLSPHHLSHVGDTIQSYRVTVTGYAEERANSWRVTGEVDMMRTQSWSNVTGKVMLYFDKKEMLQPPRYGDQLLIRGAPRTVDPPRNPGAFDYSRYLRFKNIFHQHFIRQADFLLMSHRPPSRIVDWSMRARRWSDSKLENMIPGKREQGIASALVLGITDGLDSALLSAYAATGSMHVLAVSGLHISIIYLLIVWLLKPVSKGSAGPWILAATSLVVLWGYAFLTGLSPSVLRAVTMFSFVAIAKPARQFTNIFNILAVSAFFLLINDPYLLMSAGFQLSYVAVLGIVYLQPRIYAIIKAKNYLLDEIWKLTAVSIAAQIATLPFSLLYFHQFPNYFLITNLLVVPISFVVLIAGIVAILVSGIPVLETVVSWTLTWSIKIMNAIIFVVEDLPFSLINNISFDVIQCGLLLLMIVFITLLFDQKHFRWMVASCLVVMCFSFQQWRNYIGEVNPSRLIVYDVQGHTAIDLIAKGRSTFVSDTALRKDDKLVQFHIQPARIRYGVIAVSNAEGGDEASFAVVLRSAGKIISAMSRPCRLPLSSIPSDYIIVSNDALQNVDRCLPGSTAKIILDGSNSYFYAERIMRLARDAGWEVHSVLHQGAYMAIL